MKKLFDRFLLIKTALPGFRLCCRPVFWVKRLSLILPPVLIAHGVRAEPQIMSVPVPPPAIYAARCALCHGPDLQGAAGPPLVTVDMRDRALPALKARISATMPLDAPGTLSEAQYDALANYIAIRNAR